MGDDNKDIPKRPVDNSTLGKDNISIASIYKYLNEYVVGQEEVKQVISQAFYLHLVRTVYHTFVGKMALKKSNALIMGPSGCGKSYIVSKLKALCDYFGLYFFEINAKELTPSGYVGMSIEDYFLNWANQEGIEKFYLEHSIVFVDEIDKLITHAPTSGSSDFNKEIQYSLLKALEGATYYTGKRGSKKAGASPYELTTKNILFILAGNFEAIRETRKLKGKPSMGFNNIESPYTINYHKEVMTSGLITEITGRISMIAELKQLTEKELYKALVDVKDSIYSQYVELFDFLGKDLKLSKKALKSVVKECLNNGTGTRGLQTELDKAVQKQLRRTSASEEMFKMATYCLNQEEEPDDYNY